MKLQLRSLAMSSSELKSRMFNFKQLPRKEIQSLLKDTGQFSSFASVQDLSSSMLLQVLSPTVPTENGKVLPKIALVVV